MVRDADLAGVCCVVVVVLPVYLLLGGALLIGGCALYNRFVGKDSYERVPEPGLGRAMGIVFVNLLASGATGFLLGLLTAALTDGARRAEDRWAVLVQLHSIPLGLVITGALLAGMLPTTFARGLLATLCAVLLVAMVVLVLALVVGALALVAVVAK